jgi:PAS domain S-box-containing protein
LVENYRSFTEGRAVGFYLSLFFTVGPLLALPVVLAMGTRLGERGRLDSAVKAKLDQLQNRLSYREDMLRLIADHQPGAISIFDRHNRYWFVNEQAAAQIGKKQEDIIGQPPIKILPNEQAKKLEIRLAQARASEEPIENVDRVVNAKGETRFLQRHYEAVSEIAEVSGCVMLREDDLTSLIVEKERREQMLRQVIDTLVAVVDRRDPYAAGHSSRVGQLARAIAEEMQLPQIDIEAAEIAGSLMNFGKVLVSRRILTKTSALTPDELQRVRDGILTSSEILGIIGFEGPVVPTLRQVLERFDGTGAPAGLKGDQILMTARIVSVSNAFVAFVSPRAHRESLPFRDALAVMAKEAGKAYDEKVLIALSHYIENRPNKLDWLKVKPQS